MARPNLDNIRKYAKKEYKAASKGSGSHVLEKEPEVEYDKDGYIVLHHVSELPPKTMNTDLVTDLSALEKRLDAYREHNESARIKDKELSVPSISGSSGSKKTKKLDKKARKKLLKSIFNNADARAAAEEEDEDEEKPLKENTLETTYGLRYTPMVNMYYDLIGEYDDIANTIKSDLENRPNMKTMYRSSQIANLISAKNSKMSAIKELTSIAKQITDLEYKREKDSKAGEADDDKAILALTTRFLRGSFDNDSIYDDDSGKSSGGKKKSKKNKGKQKASKQWDEEAEHKEPSKKKDVRGYVSTAKIEKMAEELQDDDDADDSKLADELGKALMRHKDELEFTPYEKHINLEGKYTLAVLADSEKPSSSWKFIAIDKDGKEIKGFKDKYSDLVPKKSDCKMSFNIAKMRVVDKNTSITYKLYLK